MYLWAKSVFFFLFSFCLNFNVLYNLQLLITRLDDRKPATLESVHHVGCTRHAYAMCWMVELCCGNFSNGWVCILIGRKEEKQRLFHGKSARKIFHLQVANHKKTNERVSAVNEGVSMYFISVSIYLSSYIDNEYFIQYWALRTY